MSSSGGTATRSSLVPAPMGAMPSRARVITKGCRCRGVETKPRRGRRCFSANCDSGAGRLGIRSYPKLSLAFSGDAKQPIVGRTSHQNGPSPAPAQAAPLGRSDTPDATTAHFPATSLRPLAPTRSSGGRGSRPASWPLRKKDRFELLPGDAYASGFFMACFGGSWGSRCQES